MTQSFRTRLLQAVDMALAAGQLTLKYFQQRNLQVERKADRSPVTIADREAESLLRDRIQREFPRDAIIGEEFGETSGTSGYRWILDPIDGTKSFIFGVPLYGTMIGVEREGRSVVGVVNVPALGECVFAAIGHGCHYRRAGAADVRAHVSENERLEAGLFLTSQVDSFAARGAAEAFQELQRKAFVTRTWGDCYGYLLVATGRADAMVDPIMNVWDAAALQPILEEAGGTFTDWQGRPTIYAGEAVGTNGRVLEEVLEITRRYPRLV
jgi:histidinol phosphatase-like enzyme (inositol monophosphatase family)